LTTTWKLYAPELATKGGYGMVRAFVLFEGQIDDGRYDRHVELCRRVPGATFRHGKVFGAPVGEPKFQRYAEFEWPDMEAFRSAARTDEFMATGKDAVDMGVRFSVHFAEVS
jgi:hypothetical protein